MSKVREDYEWITKVHPNRTRAELESFLERVAIKAADGIDEFDARKQAYVELFRSKQLR